MVFWFAEHRRGKSVPIFKGSLRFKRLWHGMKGFDVMHTGTYPIQDRPRNCQIKASCKLFSCIQIQNCIQLRLTCTPLHCPTPVFSSKKKCGFYVRIMVSQNISVEYFNSSTCKVDFSSKIQRVTYVINQSVFIKFIS